MADNNYNPYAPYYPHAPEEPKPDNGAAYSEWNMNGAGENAIDPQTQPYPAQYGADNGFNPYTASPYQPEAYYPAASYQYPAQPDYSQAPPQTGGYAYTPQNDYYAAYSQPYTAAPTYNEYPAYEQGPAPAAYSAPYDLNTSYQPTAPSYDYASFGYEAPAAKPDYGYEPAPFGYTAEPQPAAEEKPAAYAHPYAQTNAQVQPTVHEQPQIQAPVQPVAPAYTQPAAEQSASHTNSYEQSTAHVHHYAQPNVQQMVQTVQEQPQAQAPAEPSAPADTQTSVQEQSPVQATYLPHFEENSFTRKYTMPSFEDYKPSDASSFSQLGEQISSPREESQPSAHTTAPSSFEKTAPVAPTAAERQEEQSFAEAPVHYEEPASFEEPSSVAESASFEEPTAFEESTAFEEPTAFEKPTAFEEPVSDESPSFEELSSYQPTHEAPVSFEFNTDEPATDEADESEQQPPIFSEFDIPFENEPVAFEAVPTILEQLNAPEFEETDEGVETTENTITDENAQTDEPVGSNEADISDAFSNITSPTFIAAPALEQRGQSSVDISVATDEADAPATAEDASAVQAEEPAASFPQFASFTPAESELPDLSAAFSQSEQFSQAENTDKPEAEPLKENETLSGAIERIAAQHEAPQNTSEIFKIAEEMSRSVLANSYNRIYNENNLAPSKKSVCLKANGISADYYLLKNGGQPYLMYDNVDVTIHNSSCTALISDVKLASYALAKAIGELADYRSEEIELSETEDGYDRDVLYIGNDSMLPTEFTVMEYLLFALGNIDLAADNEDYDNEDMLKILLAQTGISDWADIGTKELSHNKRILLIALSAALNPYVGCIIINDPQFKVTHSDDMLARRIFAKLMSEGKGVLLSSCSEHLMATVANRVIAIRSGRVVFEGSYKQFLDKFCLGIMSFTSETPDETVEYFVRNYPNVSALTNGNLVYLLRKHEGEIDLDALLKDALKNGANHRSIVLDEKSFDIASKEVLRGI